MFHYYLFKKVLIIGANDRANVIADVIKNKYALKMEIVGFVKSAEADNVIAELNSKTFGYELSESDYAKLDRIIEQEKTFTNNEFTVFENGKDIHNIYLQTNSDIVIFNNIYTLCENNTV